ncbi:hypothetical protein D3C87_1152820 [compost metagenome]
MDVIALVGDDVVQRADVAALQVILELVGVPGDAVALRIGLDGRIPLAAAHGTVQVPEEVRTVAHLVEVHRRVVLGLVQAGNHRLGGTGAGGHVDGGDGGVAGTIPARVLARVHRLAVHARAHAGVVHRREQVAVALEVVDLGVGVAGGQRLVDVGGLVGGIARRQAVPGVVVGHAPVVGAGQRDVVRLAGVAGGEIVGRLVALLVQVLVEVRVGRIVDGLVAVVLEHHHEQVVIARNAFRVERGVLRGLQRGNRIGGGIADKAPVQDLRGQGVAAGERVRLGQQRRGGVGIGHAGRQGQYVVGLDRDIGRAAGEAQAAGDGGLGVGHGQGFGFGQAHHFRR